MSGVAAILLLAGVHGMVLALMLARRQRNRRANRYLVAMLGALVLLLFDGCLRAQGVLATHPHLIGLTAWVPFLIGPLVYLYVREMTSPPDVVQPPAWRHFLVTGAYVVVLAITFFPRSAAYKRDVAAHSASWIVQALEAALLVYGIAYAVAALVRLRGHAGWYEAPGAMLREGLAGGFTAGSYDVSLRAGRLLDTKGQSALFPIYATLAVARRW